MLKSFDVACPKLYMAMEDNMDIITIMEKLPSRLVVSEEGFTDERARKIIRPIAKVLEVLHAKNYIHRDVKLSNIMLDGDGSAILIDYGVSHLPEFGPANLKVGSTGYIAPEIISITADQEPYTTKVDIYSLGMTWAALLLGENPFYAELTQSLKFQRENNLISSEEIQRLDFSDIMEKNQLDEKYIDGYKMGLSSVNYVNYATKEMIQRMTRMDPDRRPDIKEVVEFLDEQEEEEEDFYL